MVPLPCQGQRFAGKVRRARDNGFKRIDERGRVSGDGIAVSAETYDPEVAGACLDAGATVLNFTGNAHEEEIYDLVGIRYDSDTGNNLLIWEHSLSDPLEEEE